LAEFRWLMEEGVKLLVEEVMEDKPIIPMAPPFVFLEVASKTSRSGSIGILGADSTAGGNKEGMAFGDGDTACAKVCQGDLKVQGICNV
jgi:hypothetical protein